MKPSERAVKRWRCRSRLNVSLNCASPLFLALLLSSPLTPAASSHYGRQFVGLTRFSRFTKVAGQPSDEIVWVSTELLSEINWDQLIVSWNVNLPKGAVLSHALEAVSRVVRLLSQRAACSGILPGNIARGRTGRGLWHPKSCGRGS